ncbi:thiamine ABC transporter substrate-binding protein [Neisseriaceae bacterium ESL0693]|nr:thiamine ABC transporter substrate-binding protein [Neisseriaceae bacterium ESL0693]
MKIVIRWLFCGLWLISAMTQAQTTLRLVVHQSFNLPPAELALFERTHDVKLNVIKMGGANEMLNRLILTRANPIADVVYGLDNSNIMKARHFDVLAPNQPASLPAVVSLPQAVAIDYGYVTINYDKAWFAQHRLPLPASLNDLTLPRYKNLLALPSPATSNVGLDFLMANIGSLGEEEAFEWWHKMRLNGVKIGRSWSDTYYTDFTLNGGSRPMVVSYASSPAAEIYYGKGKYRTSPTGNLLLDGGVFLQVEGAAVLNRTPQPQLSAKLVQFLQSPRIQAAIPTSMWVFPAVKGTPVPEVMQQSMINYQPKQASLADMQAKQQSWVSRWIKTVLR